MKIMIVGGTRFLGLKEAIVKTMKACYLEKFKD